MNVARTRPLMAMASIPIALFLLALAGGCGDSGGAGTGKAASAVFDIDGTLTTSPTDFFSARPDAARAVQLYVDKGYAVIYLTARPRFLETFTRNWLAQNGFPELPLYLAEGLLFGDQPAEYKTEVLTDLMEEENRIFLYAYGDSDTDFMAFNGVGISVERTWALLREGETECQAGAYAACLPGYTDHIDYIQDQPRAN